MTIRLKSGDIFEGKYRVVRLLGRGGMGEVFEVEHLRVPGRYALKLMRADAGVEEHFRERFFREIDIARGLVHPNVITIRDCDVAADGSCYFTMDLSPGRSLSKIAEGPIEWRRALGLTRQILLALGEAHRGGIVHRDMKPDNVLVEGEPPLEVAKVLDFGIARALAHDAGLTLTVGAAIVGTPAFISPEQALGEKVDGRADLYSTGVTLHKLVTGELPFRSATPTGFIGQHIAVPPPPIREVLPEADFPEELELLILRSLEKEREQRFQTAEEMIEAIDALIGPPRALTPLPTPARRKAGAPADAPPRSAPSAPVRHATPAPGTATARGIPSGRLDRAKLVISDPGGGVEKAFVFAMDRVGFGRARPKPGEPDPNALILWLLPARSEAQDPENYRATLEISGRHGELLFRDGAAHVVDRSSRGTFLDGAPLEKGQPARLPERFRLGIAGVLELEGGAIGPGGASGLVLRRVGNCEHHRYVILRGEGSLGAAASSAIPLSAGAAEEAILAPRPSGGFEIKLGRSTGARVSRNGEPVRAGAPVILSPGDELEIGPCRALFERVEESDFREP